MNAYLDTSTLANLILRFFLRMSEVLAWCHSTQSQISRCTLSLEWSSSIIHVLESDWRLQIRHCLLWLSILSSCDDLVFRFFMPGFSSARAHANLDFFMQPFCQQHFCLASVASIDQIVVSLSSNILTILAITLDHIDAEVEILFNDRDHYSCMRRPLCTCPAISRRARASQII